ncbi:melatonin receptor type 1C-like isoform X2 [Octopus sinensis]|uniref:Melatonin receptor type 1C-like isoform X2 n=1 Tax=Octopus sinensis TaxID=2607531 RepID=A0A7E6FEX1_9MOLL|nr:melatonin receptor type 1C-like isoform X2 [Octopus sinensis]
MDLLYWMKTNNTWLTPDDIFAHSAKIVPVIVITIVSIVLGTFGNIFTILAIIFTKKLRTTENIFLVNLAFADLFVSSFVNIFSAIGAIAGEVYFKDKRALCEFIGFFCLVCCLVSLFNITAVAFNRFIFICHHSFYRSIFTPMKSLIIAIGLWVFGIMLETVNFMPWGNHGYDKKTLTCIWDRTASLGNTIFITILGISLPVVITTVSYIMIFYHFYQAKERLNKNRNESEKKNTLQESKKLMTTLFSLFVVFAVCWMPYAFIALSDIHDTFNPLVHIYSVTIAHVNSCLNPVVYVTNNEHFRKAFKRILLFQCRDEQRKVANCSIQETQVYSITKN